MSDDPPSSSPKQVEKKETFELEPIDVVIENLRSQGKDKYMIAAELKQMRYKSRDIAAKLGISMRDIGVKLSATQTNSPQDLVELLSKTKVLEKYSEQVKIISEAELIQMVETRIATRYLDERARAQGFASTADYIRIATAFYDAFRDHFSEQWANGEIELPILQVRGY